MNISTAVIMAAGFGSRLKDKTKDMPKGFLELNGVSLIERSCRQLAAHGIERIFIGTGYLADTYMRFARSFTRANIECVFSDRYETTSSMYTLYNMRHVVTEPFLLLESDLLYEDRALQILLDSSEDDLVLASGATHSGDEVYLQLDHDSNLVAVSKDKNELTSIGGELVGISKISPRIYALACDVMSDNLESRPRLDYEHALAEVSRSHAAIKVHKEDHLIWCEIDDEDHLNRARSLILPRLTGAASLGADYDG